MVLYKIFLCFFVNVLWNPGHCNFIDKIFRSKSWNSKLIDFYSQEYPIKSFKERLTRTQSYFYKASYCRVKLLYKLKTLIPSSTFDNLFDILETINLSEARTFSALRVSLFLFVSVKTCGLPLIDSTQMSNLTVRPGDKVTFNCKVCV